MSPGPAPGPFHLRGSRGQDACLGAGIRFVTKNLVFTPTTTEGVLKFEHTSAAGDHTLLLDNVRVVRGMVTPAPKLTAQAAAASTFRIAYRAGKFDQPKVMPLYYSPEDWVIGTWWRKQ